MTQMDDRLKINITPTESKTNEPISFQIYTKMYRGKGIPLQEEWVWRNSAVCVLEVNR